MNIPIISFYLVGKSTFVSRQVDKLTSRQADELTSRPAGESTSRRADKSTSRRADEQTSRQVDKQTRQVDKQTGRRGDFHSLVRRAVRCKRLRQISLSARLPVNLYASLLMAMQRNKSKITKRLQQGYDSDKNNQPPDSQYVTHAHVKGGLLACKRWPFGR